jgi:hypothetical protein
MVTTYLPIAAGSQCLTSAGRPSPAPALRLTVNQASYTAPHRIRRLVIASSITSVLALSKTDVWAFGGRFTSTGQSAYAAHYDGSMWTPTPDSPKTSPAPPPWPSTVAPPECKPLGALDAGLACPSVLWAPGRNRDCQPETLHKG